MASRTCRSEDEEEDLPYQDQNKKASDLNASKVVLNKGKWSREEDEKLKRLVELHGTEAWGLIAYHFPKRTDVQCQHRWQKVLNPELVKGPWTKEEDQRVIELVHKYGPKRWSVIAKHLQGRIGKQCRERWHNHLNPEVKKSSWTEEEDRIIYEAHKRLGNRWAEIAKLLPGRTDNSIKNHWNSTMRRKVEHEGYLQETCDSSCKSKFLIKQCSKRGYSDDSHTQNQFSMTFPSQTTGYSFSSSDGSHFEGIREISIYSPPYDDDPDKEKRIKELELLLMSAENEVRRKRASCQQSSKLSSWSSSLHSDSCMTDNTLQKLPSPNVECCHTKENNNKASTQSASPSKFLAAEATAVLSSLQTIPEFAETLELIDSDPVTWSDVTSFSLSEEVSPAKQREDNFTLNREPTQATLDYQFDGSAISDISKNSSDTQGQLISLTSPIIAKFTTPPSILRRKRKEKCDASLSSEVKHTPAKSSPFSPSQFFNILGAENLNLENPSLTSTPVRGRKCLAATPLQKEMTPKNQKENTGVRTPKIRKCNLNSTPRTPTPFKNALAAQEKKYGPLKLEPQPLAYLEEDIREVLKEETGTDIFLRDDSEPPSRSWKHETGAPARRVRKSLVLDGCEKDELTVQLFSRDPVSKVKSSSENMLTSSMLMAPLFEKDECKLLSGSAQDETALRQNQNYSPPLKMGTSVRSNLKFETPIQINSEWEAVVYGKTEDQLIMTEQARKYLHAYNSGSTSRALVL
ncbi:myb-related protein A isoform X1 [Polypterus senegalus]|uniref:myb-related protein A isoform X1 n=1 Tax=Polypterus senegalus TaxID=55291 RepID=UPI00196509A0|nr:myb-related protein A isoform X1 [Polypterus senegalus]